jgi:glycosyltransferase involved in cell wall biosynthesis
MLVNEISVFFPAYNEEDNLQNTVAKALPVLKKIARRWEIIIIDDGSKDQTGKIAENLAKKDPRIRVVHHPENRGYGEALKSGFYNAQYPWIACTDADGQFDFSQIDKLLSKKKTADVIVGYRLNRQDPFLRKFFGWGWTALANILLGIKVRDVDCSFKLVKKEVIDQIPRLQSTRGGMISPELLARTKKAGFKIAEVGVRHYPRKKGKQTGANLKVIFKSFVDLSKLWWQIRE